MALRFGGTRSDRANGLSDGANRYTLPAISETSGPDSFHPAEPEVTFQTQQQVTTPEWNDQLVALRRAAESLGAVEATVAGYYNDIEVPLSNYPDLVTVSFFETGQIPFLKISAHDEGWPSKAWCYGGEVTINLQTGEVDYSYPKWEMPLTPYQQHANDTQNGAISINGTRLWPDTHATIISRRSDAVQSSGNSYTFANVAQQGLLGLMLTSAPATAIVQTAFRRVHALRTYLRAEKNVDYRRKNKISPDLTDENAFLASTEAILIRLLELYDTQGLNQLLNP